MAGSAIPIVCFRCGSQDVQWLGETRASVFVRCGRCGDVWRLDPFLEAERLAATRFGQPVPGREGAGPVTRTPAHGAR